MEVETRTLEEVEEMMGLVESGRAPAVTRIMLDNMAHRDASQPGVQRPSRLIACLVSGLYTSFGCTVCMCSLVLQRLLCSTAKMRDPIQCGCQTEPREEGET